MSIASLPPHSQEAELGVLGCILWSPNDCLNECAVRIEPEAFYDVRNVCIYESMLALSSQSKPVEMNSLIQHLKDSKRLDGIGGFDYLSQIQDATPSAANLSHYLDSICDKWMLRRLIHTCNDLTHRSHETMDAAALVDEAERNILAIRKPGGTPADSIQSLCKQTIEQLQEMFESQGKIGGLTTGLGDLDKLTDGLHGGEMIVVAAFPSIGKTAYSMQIAMTNAFKGIPVGIFSCEMRPVKLNIRAVCAHAKVNLYDVRDGLVGEDDFKRMATAVGHISKLPIHIENSSGFSIGQVVARARRLKQQHNIGLFVIDYIQLLSCDAGSREQEISAISKGIKSIAMELNVPILALSQLNDDGKLRESRAIGQDADSVWLLQNDGDWQPKVQPIKIVVNKNREGATGTIDAMFMKTYSRFEPAAKITEDDVPKSQSKD